MQSANGKETSVTILLDNRWSEGIFLPVTICCTSLYAVEC